MSTPRMRKGERQGEAEQAGGTRGRCRPGSRASGPLENKPRPVCPRSKITATKTTNSRAESGSRVRKGRSRPKLPGKRDSEATAIRFLLSEPRPCPELSGGRPCTQDVSLSLEATVGRLSTELGLSQASRTLESQKLTGHWKVCKRQGRSSRGTRCTRGVRNERLTFSLSCFPNGLQGGCQRKDLFYYVFRCNWKISFRATVWRLKQPRLIFCNGANELILANVAQGSAVSNRGERRESRRGAPGCTGASPPRAWRPPPH